MADPILVLGSVADAAGGAHTRAAVARRIAECLRHHMPLRAVAMGWLDDDSEHVMTATVFLDDDEIEVSEHREPIRATTTAHAIEQRRAIILPHSLGSRFVDARKAFEKGASTVIVVPIFDGKAASGFVRLENDAQVSPEFLERGFLNSLGRVLQVAMRNTRLIERVATLSRRAHRENQELRQQLEKLATPDGFVGKSKAMRDVLERVALVARHPTTVLLRGESGTGKEVLARRLHRLSNRAQRRFLKVNCGAIPLELVESELFGHEKGAFTGAVRRHAGLFERADGGTLLLDEVAELPQSAQVKLLRVLQDGQVNRVGAEETIDVDVRVLAATHRDLESMVQQNLFRSDLYYRLNVFPIHIPPLRERTEDIEHLVEMLLQRIAAHLGRPAPRLSSDVLGKLTRYDWPGNVRELENVLERSVIMSPDGDLTLTESMARKIDPMVRSDVQSEQPPMTFDDAARQAILRALAVSGGRIYGQQGAAELLDLNPSTLQSKMKRLGIPKPRPTDRRAG